MSLAEKCSPFDPAPDWIDQTYGQRVSSALMSLKLFGFLSENEAVLIAARIDEWVNKYAEESHTVRPRTGDVQAGQKKGGK